MKFATIGCLTALVSISGLTTASADETADTVKAITALEMKWTQSQRENRPEVGAALVADKMIVTDSDGKVSSRPDLVASERTTRYSLAEIDDLHVTVFGNAAIANYRNHLKGTNKDGAFEQLSRETDTWVKMPGGKWQCVAVHYSTIRKP